MRRHTSLAALGLAAALSLTLGGCFSPSPVSPGTEETAPPAISVDPATGDTITGTGYSFNAPEGWGIPGSTPTGVDSVVADLNDTDGFYDNINVVLSPAGAVTPEEVETAGVAELEGVGATDVQVRPRVTIAGAESAHLSALLSQSGATYRFEQYYATDAGQTCVITFSFSDTVSQADREALAESVLASWTWG
jgi:hypothetical protein